MERARREVEKKSSELSKTEEALIRAEKGKQQQQQRIEELTQNGTKLLDYFLPPPPHFQIFTNKLRFPQTYCYEIDMQTN